MAVIFSDFEFLKVLVNLWMRTKARLGKTQEHSMGNYYKPRCQSKI